MLGILRDADSPLSVIEVAGEVGLHPNTVHWHLDRLVEGGWVARTVERRGGPGRPRLLYEAVAVPTGSWSDRAEGDERGYRLLAEILASYLTEVSSDPQTAAREAGQAWGRYLTSKPAPFTRLDPAQASGRLIELLDDLGFAPTADLAAGRITLRSCPFREVAESHPEVACAVHLGLMQGALAELGVRATDVRLEPFVTPRECQAHLSPPATPRAAG